MTEPSEHRANFLRRTAKEVRSYKVTMRILASALTLLLIVTGAFYGVSALYKKSGSFTVAVDKVEMMKYGLSLSESRDMTYRTSHLNTNIAERITNMAAESLPDDLDSIDGPHHGLDHIAYTFYLQNAGEVEFPCEYSVTMANITNGLDDAIRMRLYVDGVATTYAKTRADGRGPEPGTVEFYSADTMARGRLENFAPGDVCRFTIVVWIEGNDPECLDWLIGGEMRIDMNVRVIH